MFLQILLISLVLMALAMFGMMLNIIFKKKGRFPAYRVGHNKDMKKLGVDCVKHEELRCHRKKLREAKEAKECEGCEQLLA